MVLDLIKPENAQACWALKCDFETKEVEGGALLKHVHGLTGVEQIWLLNENTTMPWEYRVAKIYKWLESLHGNQS